MDTFHQRHTVRKSTGIAVSPGGEVTFEPYRYEIARSQSSIGICGVMFELRLRSEYDSEAPDC
jgi:hypothetical protein